MHLWIGVMCVLSGTDCKAAAVVTPLRNFGKKKGGGGGGGGGRKNVHKQVGLICFDFFKNKFLKKMVYVFREIIVIFFILYNYSIIVFFLFGFASVTMEEFQNSFNMKYRCVNATLN